MFLSTTSLKHHSITSLGGPFQCLFNFLTLSVKKFFLIPNLILPWHNLRLLQVSHHLTPETRGWHAPCWSLLSGRTAPTPSAAAQRSCFLVPALASLLFSEPSCHEGPKTMNSTQGMGWPELSIGGQALP